MNFNRSYLGVVRILLFPFSLIYYCIVWCRNRLYDAKVFQSASFNLPIICVGNLSVGGTGKSPMVEYLVRLLHQSLPVATLSRGYKRKTKGYALANQQTNVLEIGDEPMLFHLKFPDVAVTVGEERLVAIPQLLHDRPQTRVVIMDDAFQHRAVKASMNILLTDCSNLFTRDWYLPTGDLRDEKRSYHRANIIVVTKCDPALSLEKREAYRREIGPLPHQYLFFTAIRYAKPYHIIHKTNHSIGKNVEVLLVTGIANPKPLEEYLQKKAAVCHQLSFNDHQIFTIDDLKNIIDRFEKIQSHLKLILTTEKDAMRLAKFETIIKDLPFYVIPIEQQFLFDDAGRFNILIKNFIQNFSKTGLPD